MLAQALTRGRTGNQNRPMRNISPETLARIGKVLRLKEQEITYLVLLKLENDSGVMSGLYGSAYIDVMKTLIREYRTKASAVGIKESRDSKNFSPVALILAELFDLFPGTAKIRLAREVLLEGKGILHRHKRRAGITDLAARIQMLDKLVSRNLD